MSGPGFGAEARAALAIAGKDVLAELRGRQAAVSTLFFAGLLLLLFGFALGPDPARLGELAPGLLWVALTFAGVLAVSRLHLIEAEDGALEQLALSPVAGRTIYAGKALAGTATMIALTALLLPLIALMYGVDLATGWAPLALTGLLGSIGFSAVGTFYAALTVRMRAREVLLPLLLLPVTAPLLLGAVKATTAALVGDPFGQQWLWIQLLAGFDVIMLVVCGATYRHLLED